MGTKARRLKDVGTRARQQIEALLGHEWSTWTLHTRSQRLAAANPKKAPRTSASTDSRLRIHRRPERRGPAPVAAIMWCCLSLAESRSA